MAVELVMPRLSESMAEGTVVSWLVADGAQVAQGQEIAEIETDKATLPYEAPEDGVLRILVPEGTKLHIGEPIALIDDLSALTGGQSVAPPGTAAGQLPLGDVLTPRPPDAEPPTASFELQPELHAPHTVHGSTGPPETPSSAPFASPSPDASWSPAWGTPPGFADAGVEPDDEGETTEFQAIDLSGIDLPEPEPFTPAVEPVEAASADQPQAQAELAPAETHEPAPALPAMPWVDPSFSPKPPTLPPRPPELRATKPLAADRVAASPVARRLAAELGIELDELVGTGPEGRIVRADIEAAQAAGATRPARAAATLPVAASELTPPVPREPVRPFDPTLLRAEPAPEPVAAEPAAEVEPELEPIAPPAPEVEPEPEPELEPVAAAPAVKPEPESAAEPEVPEPDVAPPALPSLVAEPVSHPESVVHAAPASEPTATAEAAVEQPVIPAAQPGRGKGEPTVLELTRQQQTVARRMAESKATIPDFHTIVDVDAEPLARLRAELIATRPDLAAPSVNDLVIKATAIALRAFPKLNGAYRDGRLEQYSRVNVGIAVDADGTLMVPVIHDADQLSVGQIAARAGELAEKARDGSIRPPDTASATFTLSNLGMLGVDQFTAVITPGQTAILTVGRVADRPVVRGGAVVAGQTLTLTLTCDHRAIYGAEAARFLGRMRQLIEQPTGLLA